MPATYRYEISSTNRASCQTAACKNEGVKILKGELRFGSLVTISEHDSWRWKHWGCVTPRQIASVIEQLGGLDGLDIDQDLDILDGYEELPDWAREKIKYALINGHVHDEDWKGDVELNRPGQKGVNKRKSKKKEDAAEDDETAAATDGTPAKPKKGRKKKSEQQEDGGAAAAAETSPIPQKKVTKRKRKVESDKDISEPEEKPKPKRATKKSKAAVKEEDGANNDEPVTAPAEKSVKSKKSKAGVKEEDDSNDEEPLTVPAKKGTKSKKSKSKSDAKEESTNIEQTDGASEGRKQNIKKEAAVKEEQLEDETRDAQEDEKLAASKPKKQSKTKKAKVKSKESTITDMDAEVGASQTADSGQSKEDVSGPVSKRKRGSRTKDTTDQPENTADGKVAVKGEKRGSRKTNASDEGTRTRAKSQKTAH